MNSYNSSLHGPRPNPASTRPSKPAPTLKERWITSIGEDGLRLLDELKKAFLSNPAAFTYGLPDIPAEKQFESWAQTLLKHLTRLPSLHRRLSYIDACLKRPLRIARLEAWLEDNPDPFDMLDSDELREIPSEELKAYRAKILRVQTELEMLRGNENGVFVLEQRIGFEAAMDAFFALHKMFNCEACKQYECDRHRDRIDRILNTAANLDVKQPGRYIESVIRNERAGQRSKAAKGRKRHRKQPCHVTG